MDDKPFRKIKKFELNQPRKNSLKIFKELKANSGIRFDPYRKYDATVYKKSEKTDNLPHSYLSFVTSRGLKIDVNTQKCRPITSIPTSEKLSLENSSFNKHKKTSSQQADFMSTFEESKTMENDFELLPVVSVTNPYMKLKSVSSRSENVALKVNLKYECFQLNCNSTNVFVNFAKAIPTSESEDFSKSYSSCLHLTKKYFRKVKSLKPNIPALPNLKYNPDIDLLPDYNEMTEIEISLLQRMACGCKSLTWDEFEKMYLIEEKSETKHLEDIPEKTEDPLRSCVFLSKDSNLRKLNIQNSKFHRHKNTSANYSPDLGGKRNSSSEAANDKKKQKQIEKEEDPLLLPQETDREMVDIKDAVRYVAIDHEDPVIAEENAPLEIFGIPKATVELLGMKLSQLRATDELTLDDITGSQEPEQSLSVSLDTSTQPITDSEVELQGTTICEQEFPSTAGLRKFLIAKYSNTYVAASSNLSGENNNSTPDCSGNNVAVLNTVNDNEESNILPRVASTTGESSSTMLNLASTNDDVGDITITNVTSLSPANSVIKSITDRMFDDSAVNDVEIIGESRPSSPKLVTSQSFSKSMLRASKSPVHAKSSSRLTFAPVVMRQKRHCPPTLTQTPSIPRPAQAPSIPTPPQAPSIPTPPQAPSIPTPAQAPSIPTPAQAPSIPIIQFMADESDSDDSVSIIPDTPSTLTGSDMSSDYARLLTVSPTTPSTLTGSDVSSDYARLLTVSPTLSGPILTEETVSTPLFASTAESAAQQGVSHLQRDPMLLPVSGQGPSKTPLHPVAHPPDPSLISSHPSVSTSSDALGMLNIDKARVLTPQEMLSRLHKKDDMVSLVGPNAGPLKNVAFLSIPIKIGAKKDMASTVFTNSTTSHTSDPSYSSLTKLLNSTESLQEPPENGDLADLRRFRI